MSDKLAQMIYDERAKNQHGFSKWNGLPENAKDIWRRLAYISAAEVLDIIAAYHKMFPDAPVLECVKSARDLYAPRYSVGHKGPKVIPDTVLLPKANLSVDGKEIDPLRERKLLQEMPEAAE